MDGVDIRDLERKAVDIRRLTLDEIAFLGVGHLGGAMSIIEILVMLYYRVMNVRPDDPAWNGRDKFVMSKGHAGPALYAVLADKGYFDREWLHTLNVGGTNLPSHCDRTKTPGIDMTTGSLGQGLSAALGIALGHRMQELPGRVYALLSDGDTNEGQTWEAAMAASMYGMSNLTAFVDYNRMQIDGPADAVMAMTNLVDRWTSFGWVARDVDGHDFDAIDATLAAVRSEQERDNRPGVVVLNTIKGRDIPFAEGDYKNHNMPVSAEQAAAADKFLVEKLAALGGAR